MEESSLMIQEARSVASFGREMKNFMEAKRNEFMSKGDFGLWWDRKVPEDEKNLMWFLHSFSLKLSDRRMVLKEIEKYIEVYRNFECISSCSFDEIEEVDSKLKEDLHRAEKQMKRTSSKTIYKISKEFLLSKLGKNIEKIKDEIGTQEFKKLRENFKTVVKNESEKFTKQYKVEIEQLLNENFKDAEETERMRENYQKRLQELERSVRFMEDVMHRSKEFAGNGNESYKSVAKQEKELTFAGKENFENKTATEEKIEDKLMVEEEFKNKSNAEKIIEGKFVPEDSIRNQFVVKELEDRPSSEEKLDKSTIVKELKDTPIINQKPNNEFATKEFIENKLSAEEIDDQYIGEENLKDEYTIEESENKSFMEEMEGELIAEKLDNACVEKEVTKNESVVKEATVINFQNY